MIMHLSGYDIVLLLRDVRWLLHRCPEGKEISRTCSVFFLDYIDEDEPIEIIRIHFEDLADGSDEQRMVALCAFKPRTSGPALLNEVVCNGTDLLRVMKYAKTNLDDEPTHADYQRRAVRRRELEIENVVTGAPWEQDEQKWRELLGGGLE